MNNNLQYIETFLSVWGSIRIAPSRHYPIVKSFLRD